MEENALKARRTVKNTFTRKKNKFYGALARKEHFDTVQGNFKELTCAWHAVEGKHENYTTLLENDNDADASESWIAELQEIYDAAESLYRKCAEEHSINEKEEEARANYEKLTKRKASLEDAFDSLTNHIKNLLKEDEISISKLRKNELDLTKIFESCTSIHDDIIELPLEQEWTADEVDWIQQKHAQLVTLSDQIESCINNQEAKALAKERAEEHAKENPLRMEKVRLPSFSGSIKEYPQFKTDFNKHVMPTNAYP